jgi:hypothetical protein
MTLVDANVLLYAYDADSSHHAPARHWLAAELSSGRPVRLALVTLLAFVRIATDRRVFTNPLSPGDACALIESWLDQPNVQLLQPGSRTWRLLGQICEEGQARGAMVMDAHLAALAVEHGACIATTDRDFTRFRGVEILNPIEAAGDRRN